MAAAKFIRFTSHSIDDNESNLDKICHAVGLEVAGDALGRIMRGEESATCSVDLEVVSTPNGLKLVVQKMDKSFQDEKKREMDLMGREIAKTNKALKHKGWAICSGCHTASKRKGMFRCTRCKACYCGTACQKRDWKGGHSKSCKLMEPYAV